MLSPKQSDCCSQLSLLLGRVTEIKSYQKYVSILKCMQLYKPLLSLKEQELLTILCLKLYL